MEALAPFVANMLFFALIIALCTSTVIALQTKVIVSGAAGRTGSLVLKKLLARNDFTPIGIIRTAKSGVKLVKTLKLSPDQMLEADITDVDKLEKAIKASGAEKYIMCTSAVPKIKIWSLLWVILLKIFRKVARPEFYYLPKLDPYYVDWLGAKNQIDAAKSAGITHFVFLSSQGALDPNNYLNTFGKRDGDELSGNILLWKRKAEQYLIASGMPYTILHPGGLSDKAGGENVLVGGINDAFVKAAEKFIPRADVAEVCIQSLVEKAAYCRSIDIVANKPVEGGPGITKNWGDFFSGIEGNCAYP